MDLSGWGLFAAATLQRQRTTGPGCPVHRARCNVSPGVCGRFAGSSAELVTQEAFDEPDCLPRPMPSPGNGGGAGLCPQAPSANRASRVPRRRSGMAVAKHRFSPSAICASRVPRRRSGRCRQRNAPSDAQRNPCQPAPPFRQKFAIVRPKNRHRERFLQLDSQ